MEQYKVVREIGKGGFGRALLVRSLTDGSLKVVKEIALAGMSNNARQLALRESEILGSLKHSNIVRYLNCTQSRRTLFVLMDYADGGDLSRVMARQKGIPMHEDVILDYFVQICLALKYVHDRKILHRDLKPQNVFTTKQGIVKLGDFGIARTLEHTGEMACTVVGTPLYCSPEICFGKRYDAKSDVWSLGCILYEMMALKRPFTGMNLAEITRRIMVRSPSPLPTRYSSEMRSLTMRLLQKNPEARPSVNEILQMSLIRNKAVALLGKTLAKDELNHGVFHGLKPGMSPAVGPSEINLAIDAAVQHDGRGVHADIYKEMKRMAKNLRYVISSENLIDVPEGTQNMRSGDFYFMGRKLYMRAVGEDDTVPFKIESVRVFLEELIGIERFREIYSAALACDSGAAALRTLDLTKSDVYVFQLIMQLVAYENKL